MTSVFTLCDVTLRIGDQVILKAINLDMPAHAVIGLLGHNGSGKSSLMRLLSRQASADQGDIRFCNEPLISFTPRRFARAVAYLPQQTVEPDGLTVRELAGLGRYPWHGAFGRFSTQDRQKTQTALETTNMTPFAERLADTLSGGEKQRAFLAMLVAQDAECLLLDEPISALDVAQQIDVMGVIRGLVTNHGRSVVIILHDLNIAARFCDRLIVMADGQVAAEGTPAALLHPERLKALYGVDMGVFDHPLTKHPISYVL